MFSAFRKSSSRWSLFINIVAGYLLLMLGSRLFSHLTDCCQEPIVKFQSGAIARSLLVIWLLWLLFRFNGIIKRPQKVNVTATIIVSLIAIAVLWFNTDTWINNEVIGWKRVMLVALSIAVFEELCFRGIVFSALLNDGGSLIRAALISSASFGLIHLLNLRGEVLSQDILINAASQVLFAFSMGILFCGIYAKTGWLFPGILLHFAWDVVNISKSKMKLETVEPVVHEQAGNPVHSAIFGLFILALICGGGILLLRSATRTQKF